MGYNCVVLWIADNGIDIQINQIKSKSFLDDRKIAAVMNMQKSADNVYIFIFAVQLILITK